jgi:hypothetical protein
MNQGVYFCEKTGVRLVAPGVSKAVDPEHGQDEYTEHASQQEWGGETTVRSSRKEK